MCVYLRVHVLAYFYVCSICVCVEGGGERNVDVCVMCVSYLCVSVCLCVSAYVGTHECVCM